MRYVILPLAAGALLAAAGPARAAEKSSRRTALDDSIDKALAYLARAQEGDGSWRAGGVQRNAAVTGLAVMAFLSAGHVPGEGKYGDAVEKGVRAVLKMQQPSGVIATQAGHVMYHHGICTLMLAEVVGMTDGKLAREVKEKLQKAVNVILKAQRTAGDPRGGWRYQVAQVNGSDISVTGWQLMALRAAKNVGCDVPADVIERAVDYMKRSQDPGSGGFCYMPRAGRPTTACTGTCVLGLMLCGKGKEVPPEAERAGSYLLRHLPRWGELHFYYTVYYGSQAMFQLGGNYWAAYRQALHEALLRNQSSAGAWQGGDVSDSRYGPAYCTSMAVLALTVEYRFLPIYQRGEEPPDRGK